MNLTRREVLYSALAASGLALCRPGRAATLNRPNVILVLFDDLGFGEFGPNADSFTLGQLNPWIVARDSKETHPEDALAAAKSAVPTLARLADEGVRFTDAYVAAPLCAPSRAALMTGQYAERFGGYGNYDIEHGGVPSDRPVLAELLRNSGYATAAIGKWHIAKMNGGMEKGAGQHPLERGFDYYFGFNRFGTDYYNSDILYRNYEKAAASGYLTDQFTDEAIGFIRRSKGKPFFLYLPYNAVHGPLDKPAPDTYLSRFHTGSRRIDNFYAYLYAADQGISRILDVLEEEGRRNNTLLIVLSDNGAPGGSPMPSNGPFLGFKGQVWQGGLRIPMFLWGTGVPRGKISKEPVISLDLMPTALAAAGVKIPAGYTVDGVDIIGFLNRRHKHPVHRNLFWAGQLAYKWERGKRGASDELTAPPAWATRKGRWLLRYWSHLDRYELYDMEIDKGERQDVASRHSDIVHELEADYARWFQLTKRPMAWDEEYWHMLAPRRTP